MTIKDLASKTGYAVGTVSRVLNNHPNVSEKARKAILAEVDKSGFQLNVNAKQLKQTRSNCILVVVKGTGNELFSQLVENIQNLIAQTTYLLHVDYMDEDVNEVLRAVELCREKKPLGILFLGGNSANFSQDFDKIDIPCVLVTNDASSHPFENLSSVSTDDLFAARCATQTLLDLGHRKLVMIGGNRKVSDTSRLRFEGCVQAMRSREIAFDEECDYLGVRFSYQDGYNATQQMLAKGREFTALFAAADVIAVGAIRALRDNGLRVPEDVSVMGFDGVPLSSFLTPQLATIGQNAQAMARRGVEILLDSIENGAKARHETIPFILLRRESIRPISDEERL